MPTTEKTMLVVNVITFELLRAAGGNPITVSTLDGQQVQLRLATADEVIAKQAAALADLPEGSRPSLMSREQAEALVRPIVVLP